MTAVGCGRSSQRQRSSSCHVTILPIIDPTLRALMPLFRRFRTHHNASKPRQKPHPETGRERYSARPLEPRKSAVRFHHHQQRRVRSDGRPSWSRGGKRSNSHLHPARTVRAGTPCSHDRVAQTFQELGYKSPCRSHESREREVTRDPRRSGAQGCSTWTWRAAATVPGGSADRLRRPGIWTGPLLIVGVRSKRSPPAHVSSSEG